MQCGYLVNALEDKVSQWRKKIIMGMTKKQLEFSMRLLARQLEMITEETKDSKTKKELEELIEDLKVFLGINKDPKNIRS